MNNSTFSRRDFTKFISLVLAFLCGAKATAVEKDNTSYWPDRIGPKIPKEFKLLEKAFADEWAEANKPRPGINYGGGILSDLMISTWQHEMKYSRDFDPELSDRERKIVATVIQWLGTNCGGSFLNEVNRRAGGRAYPFADALENNRPTLQKALADQMNKT